MSPTIVCIVEGRGEVSAVPLLIRRIAQEVGHYDLKVPSPIRCPKSKIVRQQETIHYHELERAIKFAALKLPSPEQGAVLILLDADDDCPARIGPKIVEIAHNVRSDIFIKVVIAKHEYESWFVAAIESLKGHREIREDAIGHSSPEDISDPKGYLSEQMAIGRMYSEILDQPALTDIFDFRQAEEKCDSFKKFRKDIKDIFHHLFDIREV